MQKKLLVLSCGLALLAIVAVCCTRKKDNKPVYPTACGFSLAGSYTGNDVCPSSGPTSYPCIITAVDSTRINFSNLYGTIVQADVNCATNSLTLIPITMGGFSISGTGTYTANTIIINWNGGFAGTPMSCTTTFTR